LFKNLTLKKILVGALWNRKPHLSACFKSSNSRDSLKFLIPNYIWKYTSGSINYTGMVITQKMNESEMGYRGSKSATNIINYTGTATTKFNENMFVVVKEQRLDGGYMGNNLPALRYSLMGFERNYQIKILSNQINKLRFYSTLTVNKTQTQLNINPLFVIGLTDAEGCFQIAINKDETYKTGWNVRLFYLISLHRKDEALLKLIQKFFGVGKIYNSGKDAISYRVYSQKDLIIILEHFDKYPLITQKLADYLLFREVVVLMKSKEHLTQDGFQAIVNIRASVNKGLSEKLQDVFPKTIPVKRPLVTDRKISDPSWLAGFTSGDGSFSIVITKSKTKQGMTVNLLFQLYQHVRDEQLFTSLVEYLGCGKFYFDKEVICYRVTKYSDISEKIIPFFKKYPIIGVKALDFNDFCQVADLMKDGKHLTQQGLDQIHKIKAGMNTSRKFY